MQKKKSNTCLDMHNVCVTKELGDCRDDAVIALCSGHHLYCDHPDHLHRNHLRPT
jgi:hypothetical protein